MLIPPFIAFASVLFINIASANSDISPFLAEHTSSSFGQKTPIPQITKHDKETRYPFVFEGINKGGYTGWFRITWDDYPSGKSNKVESNSLSINQKWSYQVPAGAKNIVVEAYTNTGVVWDKHKQAFKSTVHSNSDLYLRDNQGKKEFGYALAIFGTALHPKYNLEVLPRGEKTNFSAVIYPEYTPPPTPPCSEISDSIYASGLELKFQNSCEYAVNFSVLIEYDALVLKKEFHDPYHQKLI